MEWGLVIVLGIGLFDALIINYSTQNPKTKFSSSLAILYLVSALLFGRYLTKNVIMFFLWALWLVELTIQLTDVRHVRLRPHHSPKPATTYFWIQTSLLLISTLLFYSLVLVA